MMDLQHLWGAAILASPSIPVQDLDFECFIFLHFQSQSALLLAYSLHGPPDWVALLWREAEVALRHDH
jgi:hypothetical protein